MFKRRWVYSILLVLILIVVGSLFLSRFPSNQPFLTPTPAADEITVNKAKWDAHQIKNYTMTVEIVALPAVPIGIRLTIRDGKVTHEVLLSCEVGQTQSLGDNCSTVKQDNYNSAEYAFTVESLFDEAQCPYQTAQCSVKYDPSYGYPKQIVTTIPNTLEGTSVIAVNDFHPDD